MEMIWIFLIFYSAGGSLPLSGSNPFTGLIIFSVSADIISCVEFNQDGELLATGDKGGRVVIFQVNYSIVYIGTLQCWEFF